MTHVRTEVHIQTHGADETVSILGLLILTTDAAAAAAWVSCWTLRVKTKRQTLFMRNSSLLLWQKHFSNQIFTSVAFANLISETFFLQMHETVAMSWDNYSDLTPHKLHKMSKSVFSQQDDRTADVYKYMWSSCVGLFAFLFDEC